MRHEIDSETVNLAGGEHVLNVTWYPDYLAGPPWREGGTLGSVTDWTTRAKGPGERVLAVDNRSRRLYDWSGAVRAGRAEGVSGEVAARQAGAEYERMRAWCDNEWFYVGYVASIDGDEDHPALCGCGALWGIDGDEKYRASLVEELRVAAEEWFARESLEEADAAARGIVTRK